jgi:putative ABC transport system permease protein
MSVTDILHSLREAFSHRLRAALTLLGIAIGTGSILLLASLMAAGESYLVGASQEASSDDVIEAIPHKAPPEARDHTTRPLSRADATELAEAAPLSGGLVAAERSQDVHAHAGGRDKVVALVSASAQTLSLYRLTVEQGRAIDETDEHEGRRVCVVGHEVYEQLLQRGAVDGTLTLEAGDHVFTVVGVLQHKPMMGSTSSTYSWDRKVLLPSTTYDALYSPEHEVTKIYVRGVTSTSDRASANANANQRMARATVRNILQRRHFGVLNFTLSTDKSGGTEELILRVVQVLLLGTGVLALLASGINIMNVMLVTVSERKREIGLRRAIGATPRSILVQFLFESGALSVTGGTLGLLLGALVAWGAALGARASLGRWDFVVPGWSIALGLALALATGLVFGMLPAWRASRISPIDALRAE